MQQSLGPQAAEPSFLVHPLCKITVHGRITH
jgi:hypothetical protein